MPTITFTTNFDLTQSTKQIIVTDTSDWVGQGIALQDVNDCIKVVSPSGVTIYDNTDFSDANCDIVNDNITRSNLGRTVIALPLDASTLMPELGDYTITVTVYNQDTDEFYTPVTTTYTNEYVRVTGSILQTVDCVSPQFVSKDTTDYDVNGVTPSLDRNHVLAYPNSIDGSPRTPTSSSGQTITRGAGEFYQGVQSTTITSNLGYIFGDGLIITDVIIFGQNATVDCTDLCGILCCLTELKTKVTTGCCNPTEKATFTLAMGLVGYIQLSINCGKGDTISSTMSYLQVLLNCTDACTSCGVAGTPIIGVGTILNNVVVESGGSPIEVDAVVAGDLTTYTVKISAAFLNLVATHTTQIAALQVDVAELQLQVAMLFGIETTVQSSDNTIDITFVGSCVGGEVFDAGSLYVVGDVLTASGGTASADFTIIVDTVGGAGEILTFHIGAGGTYSVLPTNPVTMTGGSGFGATIDAVWDRDYDLSYTTKYASNTNISSTNLPALTVTEAITSGAITEDGRYLIQFEGDVNLADATDQIAGTYYACKNSITGTNISIDGAQDYRTLKNVIGASGASTTKVSYQCFANLVTTDTVGIVFDIGLSSGAGAKALFRASVIAIKVS